MNYNIRTSCPPILHLNFLEMPKQRSQRQRHARVEADFVYDHTTPISPPTTRARGRAKARKAAEATTTHIEQVSLSVASTVSERDDSTDESAHTTDSDSG